MIPEVAASEPGTAQTFGVSSMRALRRGGRGSRHSVAHDWSGVTKRTASGTVWKGRPKRVIALYAKADSSPGGVPKYGGTREILPEFAATMR